MKPQVYAALLLACATACVHTSREPRDDPAVRSPLGVHGDIDAGTTRYSGELLTISGSDFTLLTDRGVVVIPFSLAGDGRFNAIDVRTYHAPWEVHARQLKYASRYPYGIPDVALAAILRQRGQSAPDTVKASLR